MYSVDLLHLLSLIGPFSIGGVLFLLALLSQRLGSVTRAAPFYRSFYFAAILVWFSFVARLWNYVQGIEIDLNLEENIGWVLLYNGLPALALTLGLMTAWRYWSWLLAERN